MSLDLWQSVVNSLGGTVDPLPTGVAVAEVSFLKLLVISAGFCGALLLLLALRKSWRFTFTMSIA